MESKSIAGIRTQRVSGSMEDEPVGGQVPLVEVSVDLAPGMTTKTDRCFGDVPVLEVITGRARLAVSVDVGDVRDVNACHLALADQFAAAACAPAGRVLRNRVETNQPHLIPLAG